MLVKKWYRFMLRFRRHRTEKEYKRTGRFAKTRLLKPGETQTLTVEIPQKQLVFNEKTHVTGIVEKAI